MRLRIEVRSLGTALLALLAGQTTPVFGQLFKEFPISSGSAPHGITAGPDGTMWFTEYGGNRIARITPAGVVTEFAVPSGRPDRIAAGPDGALWFTEPLSNMIGRITPAGAFDVFAVPTAGSSPLGITAGPDGALWFTEPGSNGIGRLTVAGVFTEFSTPPLRPNAIVTGPDGALWFTHGNGIGRITTAGVVTQIPVPICGGPAGIAAGPDGALWFTEPFNGRIGRITTAGVFSEFGLGSNASPYEIAAGPDGALWFTDQGNNLIGRITTGPFNTNLFPLPFSPTGPSVPWGIAAGPDGAMWFTEEGRNRIGRINTGEPGAPPLTGCAPDATTLCLNTGRFKVQTVWTTSDGFQKLPGQAVSLTSDTGYFWFFSPNNVELVVKTVNACTFNSRFWVFAGGLTDVNVVLTVTDTLTGGAKVYSNPRGVAFQPIQDTAAFTCP
jgi:virginiamycin B lyase